MTRRVMIIVALAYLLGLWTGRAFAAEKCVSLKVRPTIMLLRSDVDVQIRVSRHDHHRLLFIEWESDIGYAGSRAIGLEGADAPVLFQWYERQYPPANYQFVARVFDEMAREVGRAGAQIVTAP